MDLINCLLSTGLTRQEAQLYLLLHAEGVMSGYEAAKLSGISRSNVYPALAGLVDHGAAQLADGDVQRFVAVPVDQFCRNVRRKMEEQLQYIETEMPVYRESAEPFITIRGDRHILDQMKNLIVSADSRLYLAVENKLLDEVMPEITDARDRGLKVVILTPAPFEQEGMTIFHTQRKPGQVRLIVDSRQVMTGELNPSTTSTCLYSKNQTLVTLFKEAMINEIALIRIQNEQSDAEPDAGQNAGPDAIQEA